MQDNLLRGKRIIFWTKLCYILRVLLNLSFLPILYWLNSLDFNEELLAQELLAQNFVAKMILVVIATLFLCLIMCGFACTYYVFWILWIHREGTNLRAVIKTDFSPALAIFCTTLPWINSIFDYFILRDILRSQGNALLAYGKEVAPMPNRALNGFLIASVLMILSYFIGNTYVAIIVPAVLYCVVLYFLLKVLRRSVDQGQALYLAHEDAVLRTKVEEVLREREAGNTCG